MLVSGGILDIPIIIQKLEEAIFGIFRLGWGLVKGAARRIRTFSKFVVKSVKDLINGFQEFLKFLKGEKGSFKKIIDDVFEASNIKKIGYQGGKILSEEEIDEWAKLVMKKYKTKLLKVDKFDNPNVIAAFDPMMSRKYNFHNSEGLYFISFAIVGWLDVFIRNEYKKFFGKLKILPKNLSTKIKHDTVCRIKILYLSYKIQP